MVSRSSLKKRFDRRRLVTLGLVFFSLILGLLTKSYTGPGEQWFNNSLGGTVYVFFWSMLFCSIFWNRSGLKIVIAVFLATCCLEFIQLAETPVLVYLRSFQLVRFLIGTTFIWRDFIYYILGACIALLTIWAIKNDRSSVGRTGRKISI